MSQLKQNGCRTLLVRAAARASCPIARTCRTRSVSTAVLRKPGQSAPGIVDDMEAFIKTRTAWDKRYAEVIRDSTHRRSSFARGTDRG